MRDFLFLKFKAHNLHCVNFTVLFRGLKMTRYFHRVMNHPVNDRFDIHCIRFKIGLVYHLNQFTLNDLPE